MSFGRCSKRGCDNDFSDRYNPEFGYICNDCYPDLIQYCMTKQSFSKETINEFLKTNKTSTVIDGIDYAKQLNQIFG